MLRSFPLHAFLCTLALIAGCEADDLKETASMKVVPSRIELGSLEFGRGASAPLHAQLVVSGMPPGMQVVDIDCSHARGVSVLSQFIDKKKVVVNLEVNEMQLCESEPFGAFIKKEIRLETNSPIEPQFVVPIIGWVDINNTPRDFSQFVFHGAPRWRGIWSTPNAAGALLAMIILSLVGIIGWSWKRFQESRGWAAMTGLYVSIPAIVVALILLGLTYSRGAWLAVLIGCGAVAFCGLPLRRVAWLVMMAFMGLLLILPFGMQRIESYTIVHDDLSIANRLKVWEGALQMIADHPLAGVGSGQFESVFEQDYQAFDHTAKTSTAVSDYLTVGSEHGLLVLSLILGPLLSLVILSLRLSVRTQGVVITTLTAILIGVLVTSSFSTLCIVAEYRWLSAITVLVLTGYIAMIGIREGEARQFSCYLLVQVSKWTIATLVVLFLASMISLSFLPTRSVAFEMRVNQRPSISYRAFEPRWKTSCGIILYLADCNHAEVIAHSTVRPMAAMGWEVIPVPESTDPALLRDLIEALYQGSPGLNLFVAGDSNGGRIAWKVAAEESPGIVRAGGGFDFLSIDLDAAGTLNAPPPTVPGLSISLQ
jgi:hypothetical protein